MTFRRADPTSQYRALRLVSNAGVWELGLSDYASGIRLRMGNTGRPPSVLDFCTGFNSSLAATTLLAVLRLIEPLAESSAASEIDALFPWAGRRPDLTIDLAPFLSAAGIHRSHASHPSHSDAHAPRIPQNA
jgi:hypothetical protein